MKRTKIRVIAALALSLLCMGAESDTPISQLYRTSHKPGDIPADVDWSILPRTESPPPQFHPAPHKPGDIVGDEDWSILPRSDVYEVGVSKLDSSIIQKLPEAGICKLNSPTASALSGPCYQCPTGKTPYLIRAMYAKGGFGGRFRPERHGSSLAVVWGELGVYREINSSDYAESAVSANLDFTPDKVYTELSGAW
jgi:hypothetical protein